MSQSEKKKSAQEKRKEARYSPYVDGVKNDKNEIVIRPMDDYESWYLEKFNQEFVDNHFTETNLHDELIENRKKDVAKLKGRVNKLKSKLKQLSNTGYVNATGEKRISLKQAVDKNQKQRDKIQKKIQEIKDILSEIDVKANINHSNYMRSLDILNYKSRIVSLDKSYDHSPEYAQSIHEKIGSEFDDIEFDQGINQSNDGSEDR